MTITLALPDWSVPVLIVMLGINIVLQSALLTLRLIALRLGVAS